MVEMTFTLDEITAAKLRQAATRLDKCLREVVCEAIDDYADRVWQLRERQNRQLLTVVNEIIPKLTAATGTDEAVARQRPAARRRTRVAR